MFIHSSHCYSFFKYVFAARCARNVVKAFCLKRVNVNWSPYNFLFKMPHQVIVMLPFTDDIITKYLDTSPFHLDVIYLLDYEISDCYESST